MGRGLPWCCEGCAFVVRMGTLEAQRAAGACQGHGMGCDDQRTENKQEEMVGALVTRPGPGVIEAVVWAI